MEQAGISSKSRLIALLLCVFLGCLGIHRFYAGKIGTGILMLLVSGGPLVYGVWWPMGIWWIIDVIFIACGSFRDKSGKRIMNWSEPVHAEVL